MWELTQQTRLAGEMLLYVRKPPPSPDRIAFSPNFRPIITYMYLERLSAHLTQPRDCSQRVGSASQFQNRETQHKR